MKRILVTGASGLLGLNMGLQIGDSVEMIGQVNHNRLQNVPFKQLEVDLADVEKTEQMMDEVRPEVLIHCAAMANVDECESKRKLAHRINGDVPGQLAAACKRIGTYMVHISTDAVFDGNNGPYTENDLPCPINQYALTKLTGEQQVLQSNNDASVLRVNFFGWSLSGKRSLAEWFVASFRDDKQVNGFTDVQFCPMMVNDLVDVILAVAEKRLKGLYHAVGNDALSKYAFGVEIARKFGYDEAQINPKSWRDGNLAAVRSPDLRLDTQKLTSALGKRLPGLQNGLERFYNQAVEKYPEKVLDCRIS
ncbi:MAG: SDR family oxidoreductase [Anaerolineaceae bacterium]|nr:SDR family oxidoreductase [Anaerolineaceae bacterium]